MKLTFLGTGAGVPSKERNVSAVALNLLQELNAIWLFDCGEATQHQILKTTIKPRKINKIFITHLHGDHIYGLPGLLSSRSFQGGEEEVLTIYGPPGIKKYVETSLKISQSRLTYPLEIIEFEEGFLFENEKFEVSCKLLTHGVPSYGFRIVEKSTLGELQVDKLRAIGVEPGPIYRTIKDNETTTLPDGRTIKRDDYIGPTKQGRVICILGDTRSTAANEAFVSGADVLVHEATFSSENPDLAHKFYHTTTTEAAKLAKDAGVKQLILTHISARYQNNDIDMLKNEAQSIFPNTKMAYDFFETEVTLKVNKNYRNNLSGNCNSCKSQI